MSLKLKAPDALPADGVTTVAFKAWKGNLFSFLEQDTENYNFLEGGVYATWSAQIDSPNRKCILTVNDSDPEHTKLMRKLAAANNGYEQDDFDEDIRTLTLKRNAQLSKFIQLICGVCHYTEHDDILSLSTSTIWITGYLEQHYNLEKKGAHFLKVSELHYKPDTNYQTFYREFRAAIYDNLKKGGHQVQYLNNKELDSDETMSPTFEETIVLWCLEKIDPRLPMHVNKTFGHQMTGFTTLKDLQITIFQRIPGMLQDLNDAEHNRASALNAMSNLDLQDDPCLAAFKPGFRRSPRPANNSYSSRKPSCQVCRLAGRPAAIFENHTSSTCRLRNAILNAVSTTDDSSHNLHIPFVTPDDEDEEFVQ